MEARVWGSPVGDGWVARGAWRLSAVFSFLARHRWAGVGLALVVECGALVALARMSTSSVIGIPAVVAASIGGTVAVVFGAVDGAALAFTGAVVFGSVAGWGSGELATLVVWPGVVTVAGLAGRRVERHKVVLREVLTAQEGERERLALELHDEVAQIMTSALFALRRAEAANDQETAGLDLADARQLIQRSIRGLRDLAVDLRPKALDHFGLEPAVTRLAEVISDRGGLRVEIGSGWDVRLPSQAELDVFRVVQDVLKAAVASGARSVWLGLETGPGRVVITSRQVAAGTAASAAGGRDSLGERIRLLGGRFTDTTVDGTTTIRAELPLP